MEWFLEWAGLIFCALWYLRETVWHVIRRIDGSPSDFEVYYRAATMIVRGHSPFEAYGYIYSPLFALLLSPLGTLPYVTARWFWFFISQGCLLAAAWLVWRAFGRDRIAACVVAFVWAFGAGAAEEGLSLGQLSIPLVLVVAIVCTRCESIQGIAAGVGFVLKVLPGALGLPLLLGRRWRAVLALIASAAIGVVVPWLFVAAFLKGPAAPPTGFLTGTPHIFSWSVPSLALRALDPPSPGQPVPPNWYKGNDLARLRLPRYEEFAGIGVALMVFLAGVVALTATAGGRLMPGEVPLAMAAMLSLALAASPVSWSHYQVMQYPGAAILLCYARKLRQWTVPAWTVLCGAMAYPLPAAALNVYRHGEGPVVRSPATLFLWTSVAPVACLALFWLFLREIRAVRNSAVKSGRQSSGACAWDPSR